MLRHARSCISTPAASVWLAALTLAGSSPTAHGAVEPSANPMGGAGANVLERVPEQPVQEQAATARPQRIVYTCVTPGLTTFSDRPCGPLPERRRLELPATRAPAAGEAPSVVPGQARAATKPAAVTGRRVAQPAARMAKLDDKCLQLQDTAAALDRQMRAGYSAREAPRLWERWRDARERLRAAGCR